MKRLPPEIVGLIHGHLDPLSTFHLTLACRQIAFHSQDALKLNRRRHEMYRTVSDQDKTAVSAILNDAAIGWHVRCLEFWNGDAIVADEDHAGDTLGVLTHSRSYTDSEELKDRIQSPNGLNHGENLKVQNALQTQLLLCCSRIQMLKQRRHAQTSTRIDQNTLYALPLIRQHTDVLSVCSTATTTLSYARWWRTSSSYRSPSGHQA